MPRNKRLQDREEKRDFIIAAAHQLFLAEGYDATAMSKLANAAGIAPNTIYWYFKDKDDVLVAVLNKELSTRMAEYVQCSFASITERLLWVIEQLELASRLVSTVHARLAQSPAINLWHSQFHALTEGMLRLEMQNMGIEATRIEALLHIWVFTMEGLMSHSLTDMQKRQICEALALHFQ